VRAVGQIGGCAPEVDGGYTVMIIWRAALSSAAGRSRPVGVSLKRSVGLANRSNSAPAFAVPARSQSVSDARQKASCALALIDRIQSSRAVNWQELARCLRIIIPPGLCGVVHADAFNKGQVCSHSWGRGRTHHHYVLCDPRHRIAVAISAHSRQCWHILKLDLDPIGSLVRREQRLKRYEYLITDRIASFLSL
jgi:hypothetical protein